MEREGLLKKRLMGEGGIGEGEGILGLGIIGKVRERIKKVTER